jgi:predicted PurR-regulated permease PerM
MVNGSSENWLTRGRVLTIALGLGTLLALYVCYLLIKPFVPAITVAVAVAVATKAPHNWLRGKVRSKSLAAGLSVVLVGCLIVVPLSLLVTYLVGQIRAEVQQFTGGGQPDWRSALHLPPTVFRAIDWIQANLDIQRHLNQLGQYVAEHAGAFLAGSLNLLTQLVIMLFVLFFLYRDREEALAAVKSLVPLTAAEAHRMLTRVEETIRAIVNGSLAVAFIQAMLAGLMYAALSVPAPALWASVTFIVALIPVGGTFLVWGPVALVLLLSGSWIKASILVGWGILAVGTIDNLLYPTLVGSRLRVHTILTFFAILGGIALFGPAGLILGPVVLAVTLGLLEIWSWRTDEGSAANSQTSVLPTPP